MKQVRGFTLIMAIFVLVVVGLLGSYMVRMSGVQMNTSSYALQGSRAYLAARSGIEWAIATLNNGGTCAQVNAQTSMTFAGLNGFSVSLACGSQSFSEATQNLIIYTVSAFSQSGNYTDSNYVARQIQVTLVQ